MRDRSRKEQPMNIGVIGTGQIGEVTVRKLQGAGYSVKMANSRGSDSLRDLAAATGATPVSLERVVRDVDILLLLLPQTNSDMAVSMK
jgi:8-hydroxy-5-deazaflavin:NADPH oxidoreductase